jgi:hypothetical protein
MTKKKTHRGRLQAQGVTRLKIPRLCHRHAYGKVKVGFNALETCRYLELHRRKAGLFSTGLSLFITFKRWTDAEI